MHFFNLHPEMLKGKMYDYQHSVALQKYMYLHLQPRRSILLMLAQEL